MRSAPIPCSPRRRVGWARRFRGAQSPGGALQQGKEVNGAHGVAVGGQWLRRPGAARARACDGRLRGAAPGGRLRARLAARWGCGGASCVPIAGAGGVRCGRPGLVRLAAVGRAPRLCRAGGGGVTAGHVRFPVLRRAALVGGGIAAAPSLSSTGACSSPCLLRVPMWCGLELCTLVLGVWCTCAAFAQIVRRPLVNVVDIAGRSFTSCGARRPCIPVDPGDLP